MISAVLQQVTRIPLAPRRWTRHPRLGQHPSRLRGSGMAFDQIKEYQAGEAVRRLNWAATARRGGSTLMMNTYFEEKEVVVMLLVDLSASMAFGSSRVTKKTLAAEICASLIYSALLAQDRTGFLGFTTEVVGFWPPRLAWTYLHTIPETILRFAAAHAAADFPAAVERFLQCCRRPTLVFVLSDFLYEDMPAVARALARLRQRHEPIAVVLSDPRETAFAPYSARLTVRDLETGQQVTYRFSRHRPPPVAARATLQREATQRMLQSLGIPFITATAHSDYGEDLRQLLLTPRRRGSG